MKHDIKGYLFDLDGVLIDSESTYTEFWAGVDRLYPTGIPDFAHAIKGTNLASILQHFPEELREDVSRRIHEFEQTMAYPYYPCALELLTELKSQRIPIAIVTSSDDVKMAHLFDRHPELRTLVDAFIDGSMVTRSKPDPQGYLLGAEAIGIDISDCVVVEDSLQGLEAGRRSGAHVVGLATTNARADIEEHADMVFDTIADFRSYII